MGEFGYSVSPGQQAYMTVYVEGVLVPGWFRDCGNGWDYGGRALVPEDKSITFHMAYHG